MWFIWSSLFLKRLPLIWFYRFFRRFFPSLFRFRVNHTFPCCLIFSIFVEILTVCGYSPIEANLAKVANGTDIIGINRSCLNCKYKKISRFLLCTWSRFKEVNFVFNITVNRLNGVLFVWFSYESDDSIGKSIVFF